MLIFPNCKINLGLHILSKREDHYHQIETIFLPLSLSDMLEVIEGQPGQNSPTISMSGIPAEMNTEENICCKAWSLLKKDYPTLPAIHTHLYKNIPLGAGLGGGSADGAMMLILLNKKFKLDISSERLAEYALQLGSDCPFFIMNKPCVASSRGEILQEISLDLSHMHFVLIYPGVHINTAWAFSRITPQPRNRSLIEIIQMPISTWREQLVNDFETVIFNKYLQLKDIKNQLYSRGALYASMSGSGSCVFGIFEKKPPSCSFPSHYQVYDNVVQLVHE
ncbi:MAG: 4-(cytidine 5'-diphospho)-2-C-methyl-D-erythritol kinase [Bacteroidetes bacterium]|nr:4-(cytidine 5'-diphospho)-2-C-methyl-D-erythritol kinase [Bacteroidota bacterium]